jgi:glycosyltransferase involved in cell wall biosynthesis
MTPVSVIMTAFNGGQYIIEAVGSLLDQDHAMWELVLVDNGSTDGSINEELTQDTRIRLIRLETNIGRTPALQLALSNAIHPYVAVLDADDIAMPKRLATQAQVLDSNPDIALIGTCVHLIDEDSHQFDRLCLGQGLITHDQIAERNMFVNSSVMYRRVHASHIGGYDDRFEYAQDYHLFIRLATVGKCVILEEPLTSLRITRNSYTHQSHINRVRARDETYLFEFASQVLSLTRRGRRLNRRRRALSNMYLGLVELRLGNIRSGLRCFARGLLIDLRFSWIPYLVSR